MPQTNQKTQAFLDASFDRAIISFTIAKGFNALISVAQGTEIAATPAGLGVVFAAGEILDPFNDMVERFSWVMLASTVSIGIQKIILSISGSSVMQYLFALFGLLILLALGLKKYQLFLSSVKFFLFLFILRFFIPLLALGNEVLYHSFLEPSYTQATHELEQTKAKTKELMTEKKDDDSWLGKVKEVFNDTMDTLNIKKHLQDLQESLDKSFKDLLTLMTIFIMQTIITPLLFIYIFIKLLKITLSMSIKSVNVLVYLEQVFYKKIT